MNKLNFFTILPAFLVAGILGASSTLAFANNAPVYCDNVKILNAYDAEYRKTNNINASANAAISKLSDAFKNDAALSRFIVAATDGKLIKEIETVTAVTKGYSINPKTLSSAKLQTFFKNTELKPQSISTGLTDGYDRLALFVSAAGFASNVVTIFQTGDRLAHAKAAKDVVDISSALAVSKYGWQGLSIAFNSVAFLDYALNTFITEAYKQYDEYWWQSYRSYMDENYPKMVSGKKSWAALMQKNDGGEAFNARLEEFWSTSKTSDGIASVAERAAHYYKDPSPFQRDALAGSTDTMKKAFASRYYTETLKTTLDTYSKRQAEKLKDEAEDKLAAAVDSLCEYMTELKSLQVEVSKLQKRGVAETEEKETSTLKETKKPKATSKNSKKHNETKHKKEAEVVSKNAKQNNAHGQNSKTTAKSQKPRKPQYYDTCRNAARDNLQAERGFISKAKQVNKLNKPFFDRIRASVGGKESKMSALIEKRKAMKVKIASYQGAGDDISDGDMASANALIESVNANIDDVRAIYEQRKALINGAQQLMNNRRTMDCGQYTYSIKNSSLGKEFDYDHETAYAICAELTPIKMKFERSAKVLDELSCLGSNGILRREFQDDSFASDDGQEEDASDEPLTDICGIDITGGSWLHPEKPLTQSLTVVEKMSPPSGSSMAYKITFNKDCTKYEEVTPQSGAGYTLKGWWPNGSLREDSVFWRVGVPKSIKRWNKKGKVTHNYTQDENGKNTKDLLK